MKSNSKFSIWNMGLFSLFLALGLVCNPFLLPILLPDKVGKHLDALSFGLILLLDIIALSLSCFFFKIRKIALTSFVRKNWREFLTFGCSTIICFFLAEGILWTWITNFAPDTLKSQVLTYYEIKPQQRKFVPYLYLNYALNREYVTKSGKEHNSFGYRGPECTLEKPEHVFRIICLGGSTTYTGKVSDWRNTYPALLENVLHKEYGYHNVEVINAGAPAYSTWETLINFEFRALDLNPDMIIIYHAINDLNSRQVLPNKYHGDNSSTRKSWEVPEVPLWKKSMILRLLNNRYAFFILPGTNLPSLIEYPDPPKNTGASPLDNIKKNPPVYFERNLRSMIAIAKDHNIEVVLSTFAYTTERTKGVPEFIFQGIEEHNQVIKNLSEKYKLPLIDFKSLAPQENQYWIDTVHVSESGAYLKAKAFADFLHANHLIPSQAGEINEQTVNY